MEDIIAIIGGLALFPLIIFISMHYRYKAREKNVELIKSMLDTGKDITPDIIKSVGFTAKRSHSDLRTGMILVATGLAMIVFGGVIPEDEAQSVFGGLAMFPALIGITYLIFWYAISRKDPEHI